MTAAALAVLTLAAVVSLFWNPWSVPWLSMKAYDSHLAGQYALALKRYDQILALDPEDAWARENRNLCVQSLH